MENSGVPVLRKHNFNSLAATQNSQCFGLGYGSAVHRRGPSSAS